MNILIFVVIVLDGRTCTWRITVQAASYRLLDKCLGGLADHLLRSYQHSLFQWCDEGFIIQHGVAPKSRKYELADKCIELVL